MHLGKTLALGNYVMVYKIDFNKFHSSLPSSPHDPAVGDCTDLVVCPIKTFKSTISNTLTEVPAGSHTLAVFRLGLKEVRCSLLQGPSFLRSVCEPNIPFLRILAGQPLCPSKNPTSAIPHYTSKEFTNP